MNVEKNHSIIIIGESHTKLRYGDENMEHYKILGVDEKSSMEEVKRAYENKVNEYREIIKDEKRLKSFIKEFDKAYEEIKKEKEESKAKRSRTTDNIYDDNEEYIFKIDGDKLIFENETNIGDLIRKGDVFQLSK